MKRRTFLKTMLMSGGAFACHGLFGCSPSNKANKKDATTVLRHPDSVTVLFEDGQALIPNTNDKFEQDGVAVTFAPTASGMKCYLSAEQSVKAVIAQWDIPHTDSPLLLGDHWERGYGDLQWKEIDGRIMPWYFMEYNGKESKGVGVKTGCSAFCAWHVYADKITLTMDVRNGAEGVRLGSRELCMCEIVTYQSAEGENAFHALRNFCKVMCPRPNLPEKPVYGINDWYFAYGNNSDELILQTVDMMVDLAENESNRPFCLIDAGWACVAPGWKNASSWSDNFYTPGAQFKDMAALAAKIKEKGMRPGLWMRPLCAPHDCSESLLLHQPNRHEEKEIYRDPTIAENRAYFDRCFRQYHDWGYEMVKHDYSTYDIFGRWGVTMLEKGMTTEGWHFHDRTKTNAEIILDLYHDLRRAAGDIMLIGCNTVSHLSAGIFELQRVGDDTSGREWARTLKMGVNTLAFRLAQHNTFYAADADCVGLTTEVPWRLNAQWMELVAKSGTPLFISAQPAAVGAEQRAKIKECFDYASRPLPQAEPLDWMETLTPSHWLLDNKEQRFNWKE